MPAKLSEKLLLGSYIQPGILSALFDESGQLKNQDFLKGVKTKFEGKEIDLAALAGKIPLEMRKAQSQRESSQDALQAQQDEIAANLLYVTNCFLGTLQSFIVSTKLCINYLVRDSSFLSFSFSDPQKLELIRQRLTSEKITIVEVARLFEIGKDSAGQDCLKLRVEVKDAFNAQENLKSFLPQIEQIGQALQTELQRRAQEPRRQSDLETELKALQDGKIPNWYDFDFLHKQNEKAVKVFKTVMKYLTEYLITAVTILKDFVNYLYSYYKDQPLVAKNSDELLDGLMRSTKAKKPLDYAMFTAMVKKQQESKVQQGVQA